VAALVGLLALLVVVLTAPPVEGALVLDTIPDSMVAEVVVPPVAVLSVPPTPVVDALSASELLPTVAGRAEGAPGADVVVTQPGLLLSIG